MKMFMIPLASVSLSLLAFGLVPAQEKIDAGKLPPRVAQAVKSRFPGAMIVQITKETENNEVVYDIEMTKDGKKHEMDCKEDGTLVDVQNEIKESDLPAAVRSAISAKYAGSRIKEVGEILVVKDGQETRDHYEVILTMADGKEVEVAFSLDGTQVE